MTQNLRSRRPHTAAALGLGIAFAFLFASARGSAHAGTVPAASASSADVSAAVSAAQTGDTVTVPAGQAVWASPLVITKGISLIGAGIGQTVITSGYTARGDMFDNSYFLIAYVPASPQSNPAFRLSGFTFDLAGKCSGILVKNETTSPVRSVRIDHVSLSNPGDYLMHFYGTVYGVVDNNVLKGGSIGVRINGLDEVTWKNIPFEFGTADNIYFEDNVFTGADSMFFYGEMGGRYCLRFNTFDATASRDGLYPFADMHGNQANAHLATMGAEIYGNVVNLGNKSACILDQRGGKALVYDNTFNTSSSIWSKVREEYNDSINPPANSPINGQPQHVSDSYYWGNKRGGTTLFSDNPFVEDTVNYGGTVGIVPQENRDFWKQTSGFNGTAGVGVGLLSARPAAASAGVGYWATDTKTLYRATSTNTWLPYYTPYPYPHPLRNDGGVASITLLSPNGGEIWAVGAQQTITWASTGSVGNVKVEYSTDNGLNWTVIAASAANTGSLAWTVPNSPSANCWIRISQAATGSPSDVSNAAFTIASQGQTASVKVVSPNGGESWPRGSTAVIMWSASNMTGTLTLSLYKGGALARTIGTASVAAGAKLWTVPTDIATGTDYRVRVEQGTVSDSSDANFAIASAVPTLRPKIGLGRTLLNFGAVASGGMSTSAQSVAVINSGSGTLNWTAVSLQSWLTVSPGSGFGAGKIKVGVVPLGLPPGTQTGAIAVYDPNAANSPQTISVSLTVYADGTTSPPLGYMDTPQDGAAGLEGSIPVTGWALDDIQAAKVQIWRDPVAGETPSANGYIYIGDAVFVAGSRPDVETAYASHPLNDRAGWGYMLLTNFLPRGGNGTYRIHAIASDAEGRTALLGSKSIMCDNAAATLPFGSIDTPSMGGTASTASYIVFGWALTPLPKVIPPDGSTILVWVDGVPVGHPVYNNYRADVASLFPGLANTAGAVGYFLLNTTAYADGMHTIAWSVADSGGAASGIGSRYFYIGNDGLGTAAALGLSQSQAIGPETVSALHPAGALSPVIATIGVTRGFDVSEGEVRLAANRDGIFGIEIGEAERLEVRLGADGGWVGHSTVGSEPRPLPVGSTLDSAAGVFSWLPGPGFLGDYELTFRRAGRTAVEKILRLRITIRPRNEIFERSAPRVP